VKAGEKNNLRARIFPCGRIGFLIGLSLLVGLGACRKAKLDVPYVPTPHRVVDEMLRMAEVNSEDVLYDLGCGDGRIVITAARKFGIRGVGVDIDPQRIRESRKNALQAKVDHMVRFHEQNLFDTDLREATVVTLYLLSEVNLILRPKILADLEPGTRIVSHDFRMNEWIPDKTSLVIQDGRRHWVYYWRVPANISGIWELSFNEGFGNPGMQMNLNQVFQYVHGRVTGNGKELSVNDAKLKGRHIWFSLENQDEDRSQLLLFYGQVTGDNMEGEIRILSAGKTLIGKWTAQRDPSTIQPLDSIGYRPSESKS